MADVSQGVQSADIYTLILGAISLLVVGGMCVIDRNSWWWYGGIDTLTGLLWNKCTLGVQDYGLR